MLFAVALFVLGLAFGSFLNVCIARLPHEESVVRPRSHCRACSAPVRWYDNVPVVSWLLLRGRCRDCQARIAFSYPAAELLTGILFVAVYLDFDATWLTLKYCIFVFLLVGLIFMDAETGLLPREFTYTGMVLGIALSWIALTDYGAARFLIQLWGMRLPGPQTLSLLDSMLGAGSGAAFFYLAWALYYLARKRHGLGFGDVALMAMIGAFLGLKLAIFVISAATLSATLWAVLMLAFTSRAQAVAHAGMAVNSTANTSFLSRELRFGVFLGIWAIAAVFIGENAWRWYLHLFL